MQSGTNYNDVIAANIELHTKLSNHYNTCEPQYRPENLKRMNTLVKNVIDCIAAKKVIDLGCGTGFMINFLKNYVDEITGVDVTQAMLDKVDLNGKAAITLVNNDTGSYAVKEGHYDLVTAHSFLHHLYDIKPTLATAAKALRKGGKFLNELDPNFYFWESINQLNREGNYHPIIKKEIEAVSFKDEDIEKTFGVDKTIFNNAEYGKSIKGGFKEEDLTEALLSAGFSKVEITYHWFIGQAALVNDQAMDVTIRNNVVEKTEALLNNILPLTRNLFKYIGFIATK